MGFSCSDYSEQAGGLRAPLSTRIAMQRREDGATRACLRMLKSVMSMNEEEATQRASTLLHSPFTNFKVTLLCYTVNSSYVVHWIARIRADSVYSSESARSAQIFA